MKKIKLLSIIALLISFMLSSCNSSLTITKRHSKKGYYVATNKIKSSNLTKNESDKIKGNQEENTAQHFIIDPLATSPEQKSTIETDKRSSTDVIILRENNSSEVSDLKTSSMVEKKTDKNLFQKTKSKINTIKTLKRSVFKSQKAVPMTHEGDALSLLWIIILILLILWILGLLTGGFGIGGLINLLWIIALVLLILWLLRIL